MQVITELLDDDYVYRFVDVVEYISWDESTDLENLTPDMSNCR